jgi:hypothetical protein
MIDRWLEEATPREAEVPVCLDGKLVSRLKSAKARLVTGAIQMLGDEEQLGLKAEIEQLEAEVRENTRVFVFKSLGWGQQRDLIAKHPPQADQAEAFERVVELNLLPRDAIDFSQLETNRATLVPAMLAATCVKPGMTPAQALELIEVCPTGVMSRIWDAVVDLNNAGRDDPFVLGFVASEPVLATVKK